jgi:hypothetical protein
MARSGERSKPSEAPSLRARVYPLVILAVSTICVVLSGCALTTSGNSGFAELSVIPASLNFGDIPTLSSGRQSVTLTNSGNSDISITQVVISGAGFSATGLTPNETLKPGQSASLIVSFAPTAAGDADGNLVIESNAIDSPTQVLLSGSGLQYGLHSVTLTWTATTSIVAGYNIYRGTTEGGPYTLILNSALVPATTFRDTDVVAGHTYYYVVSAVGPGGDESVYSNQASATIPSP